MGSSRLGRRGWILVAIALFLGIVGVGAAQDEDPPTAAHSVARLWNEQLLGAIRADVPKPPVHARNLFHLSVAMWDAWAAYDDVADGYVYTDKEIPPASVEGSSDEGNDEGGERSDEDEDEDEGDDADDEDGDGDVQVYDEAIEAARAEAISFAAYRVLQYRFPVGTGCHPGAAAAQEAFHAQMDALGYDRTFTSPVGSSPAAVGNRIANAVIAYGQQDSANEGPGLCYPDDTGYVAANPPLVFKVSGNPGIPEPNRWQPLAFDFLVLQNGIIVGAATQGFVGVGWGDVLPFALTPVDIPPPDLAPPCWTVPGAAPPYFDPGCPPQLAGIGDATLKEAMLELIRFSGWADPAQGVMIDASPGAIGNNPLGTDDGLGHPVNPFTGQPYAPNLVNRADYMRVVAQSWSDGPASETPPGHWNVMANEIVADRPDLVRRIGGIGPTVNALEWDVKVYLALNGAVHDAAIGSWSTKHTYDSARPISLIRYMAGLGQSSGPEWMSYSPDGVLLEPGLVEVITRETVAPGGRHEHLRAFCEGGGPNTGLPCDDVDDCPDDGFFIGTCVSSLGKIAVNSWLGPPDLPETQTAGVGFRLASTWMPFFPRTFVTPPFPGYTSGHSTFSRAAAEILTAITGTPYFPGGLGTFEAEANLYLEVEDGPSATIQLQWATYYDAADEAGISRRFGGIHPFYDDFPARIMGSQIGQKAWTRARQLYDGTAAGGVASGEPPSPSTLEGPRRGFHRSPRAVQNRVYRLRP